MNVVFSLGKIGLITFNDFVCIYAQTGELIDGRVRKKWKWKQRLYYGLDSVESRERKTER